MRSERTIAPGLGIVCDQVAVRRCTVNVIGVDLCKMVDAV